MEDSSEDNLTTRSLLKGILATEPVRTAVWQQSPKSGYRRPSTSRFQQDENSSSPSMNLRSKLKDRVRRSIRKSTAETSILKRNVESTSKTKTKSAQKGSFPIMDDLDKITPRTLLKKIIQNEDEVSIVVSQRSKAVADDDKKQKDTPTAKFSSLGSLNLSLPDLQDTGPINVFRKSRTKRKMRVSEFEREVDERLPKHKDNYNISRETYDPSSSENTYTMSRLIEGKLDISAVPETTLKKGLLRRPNKKGLLSLGDFEQGVEDKYQLLKGSQECFIPEEEKSDSSSNEVAQMNTELYLQSINKDANSTRPEKMQRRASKLSFLTYSEVKEANDKRLETPTRDANRQSIFNAQSPKENTDRDEGEANVELEEGDAADVIGEGDTAYDSGEGKAADRSGEYDAADDSGEGKVADDSSENDTANDSEEKAVDDSEEEAVDDSGEGEAADHSGESDAADDREEEAASDSGEAADDSGEGEAADDRNAVVHIEGKMGGVESKIQQNNSRLTTSSRKSTGINKYFHNLPQARLSGRNSMPTAESVSVHTVSRPEDSSESSESNDDGENLDLSRSAMDRGITKKKDNNQLMLTALPETPAYMKHTRIVNKDKPAISKKIQKTRRAPPKNQGCVLSSSQVKQIFSHHAKVRVSKEALADVEKCLDLYVNQLAVDLSTYSAHASRKTITRADVELLMKRQRLVTDTTSLNVLIEKHLPLECRRLLIPCVVGGNKVFPNM
ncbi:centromere protein T [Dendropsophus ebraccatus]|uniref:centromere protein T n=1 Tax=Dendropsophus ebraccatus TaxID=150705 RepID=UPI0038314477